MATADAQRRPTRRGALLAISSATSAAARTRRRACLPNAGAVPTRRGAHRGAQTHRPTSGLIGTGVWHDHAPLRGNTIAFMQGLLPVWSDVGLSERDHHWAGRLPLEPSCRLLNRALRCETQAERRTALRELLQQVLAESVSHLEFKHPALRRMVELLWNRIHHGLSVAELVQCSGMSRAQAYRLFTAGYGVAPKQAISDARLALAEACQQAGLGPGDCAQRAGFSSPSAYRRATG
ncbi:MAG: AraC family transcriptional regulator [Planctomycetota bacterium]|nr:AraC family transcriptional regulator [Planctomycetota bacterium]